MLAVGGKHDYLFPRGREKNTLYTRANGSKAGITQPKRSEWKSERGVCAML